MGFLSGLTSAMTGGLIDTGGSIAGTLVQANASKRLMSYQYKLNQKSLLESPTAQLQGIRNAGLNPILYMSQGSTSYPTVSAGSASAPDLGHVGSNAIGHYLQAKRLDQQDRMIEAQVKQSQANADLSASRAKDAEIQANNRQSQMDAERLKLLASTDFARDQLLTGASNRGLNAKKLEQLDSLIKSYQQGIKESDSRIRLNEYNSKGSNWYKNLEAIFSIASDLGIDLKSFIRDKVSSLSSGTQSSAKKDPYEWYWKHKRSKDKPYVDPPNRVYPIGSGLGIGF